MHSFSASGGSEKGRRSKGLPIDARGVGWLAGGRCGFRVLQYLLLFVGVFMAAPARSETVTMVWNGSDPGLAGYRIYYGMASRDYRYVIDVGAVTSCTVPPNLIVGTTYFLAVTAYNYIGLESDFSSEIVYTPRLQFTSIFSDDYGTVLTWASEPGGIYRILAANTLTDPVWVDVSGPLFAPSTTRLWPDLRPPSARGSTFYRIETLSVYR